MLASRGLAPEDSTITMKFLRGATAPARQAFDGVLYAWPAFAGRRVPRQYLARQRSAVNNAILVVRDGKSWKSGCEAKVKEPDDATIDLISAC